MPIDKCLSWEYLVATVSKIFSILISCFSINSYCYAQSSAEFNFRPPIENSMFNMDLFIPNTNIVCVVERGEYAFGYYFSSVLYVENSLVIVPVNIYGEDLGRVVQCQVHYDQSGLQWIVREYQLGTYDEFNYNNLRELEDKILTKIRSWQIQARYNMFPEIINDFLNSARNFSCRVQWDGDRIMIYYQGNSHVHFQPFVHLLIRYLRTQGYNDHLPLIWMHNVGA